MNSFALYSFVGGSLVLAACSSTPDPAPADTGTPTDGAHDVAADITADVAPDTTVTPADAGIDARPDDAVATDVTSPSDAMDAGVDLPAPTDAGPCGADAVAPDDGSLSGYIRFINLARGAGTVRFIARSLPAFQEAYAEAVVPEGESTLHLETLPVGYAVQVVAAGDASPSTYVDASSGDAGALNDGPGGAPSSCDAAVAPGAITGSICTDVYFRSGCTIVLTGSPSGSSVRGTQVQLWRLSDIPTRTTDCDVGQVRVLNAYAEGPALDVDLADGTPIARIAQYYETTGFRRVPSGMQRFNVRSNETGMPLGMNLPGAVVAGHPHTLYVWGDARNATTPGVSALVVDDLPPPHR